MRNHICNICLTNSLIRLTIISSRFARSSSIFWNGVFVASCSIILSCSFLFLFRFSITLSSSLLVFRTLTPLQIKADIRQIVKNWLESQWQFSKCRNFTAAVVILMQPGLKFPLECTKRVQPKMMILWEKEMIHKGKKERLTKLLWQARISNAIALQVFASFSSFQSAMEKTFRCNRLHTLAKTQQIW